MGMDVSPQGVITSLKSGSDQLGRLANGGVYWVNPVNLRNEKFPPNNKFSLEDDIFPAAGALGQHLMGLEFSGTFIDIGVPTDYYRAPALLKL
jgi:D-glycero-alpha-D-manno-heptose 1-phosphate guanylyltransferase